MRHSVHLCFGIKIELGEALGSSFGTEHGSRLAFNLSNALSVRTRNITVFVNWIIIKDISRLST